MASSSGQTSASPSSSSSASTSSSSSRPTSKRKRVDSDDDHFQFHGISFDVKKNRMKTFAYVLNDLLIPVRLAVTVRPLHILNCNAADTCGIPFSKAYCSVETNKEVILIADIFSRGLQLVVDFLTKKEMPSAKQENYLLCKLLHFINEDKEVKAFQNIDRLNNTELTTLLANHLFGRLSTSSEYIIDKNCSGNGSKNKCPCGKSDCKLTGSYGDTSIGNGEVWHGNVDIIVNDDVCVAPMEDKQDSPGGKSPLEFKLKSTNLSRNSQIIAETIVFSFLQKKRHPEKEHFLTPCIGVGSSELVIMLYDAEHDILLESSRVPLMEHVSDRISKFSLQAILVSWLVVNYKYLCDGLTEEMKTFMKADFLNQAKKKINIYENNLKFQNVGISMSSLELIVDDDVQIKRGDVTRKIHKEVINYLFQECDLDS